jgi:hypothetical protein
MLTSEERGTGANRCGRQPELSTTGASSPIMKTNDSPITSAQQTSTRTGSRTVNVRVAGHEHDKLRAAAADTGLTVAAWLRVVGLAAAAGKVAVTVSGK